MSGARWGILLMAPLILMFYLAEAVISFWEDFLHEWRRC